jgi:hypothetical protein
MQLSYRLRVLALTSSDSIQRVLWVGVTMLLGRWALKHVKHDPWHLQSSEQSRVNQFADWLFPNGGSGHLQEADDRGGGSVLSHFIQTGYLKLSIQNVWFGISIGYSKRVQAVYYIAVPQSQTPKLSLIRFH